MVHRLRDVYKFGRGISFSILILSACNLIKSTLNERNRRKERDWKRENDEKQK